MHSKRVTVYDIAARLGVSHTTVAMALRNHPSVSLQRREEVRRMAETMGYAPDPHLAALAAYRRGTAPARIQNAIAWINHWDQPANLRKYREYDLYWRGAEAAARRFGYHLEEIPWSPGFPAKRFEQILVTRGIGGILIPPHTNSPDWGDFDWHKFSAIRFGLSVAQPNLHLVTADQLRAILMAVQKIHDYGYERIGLVVGEDDDQRLGGNFVGGFAAARQLFKLPPCRPCSRGARNTHATPEKAQRALQRWMMKNQPDAIITAIAAVPPLLKTLGWNIPNQVAVAGTSMDVPVEAGIDQHSEAIGRIAVEMLVSQINLNECGEPAEPCRILVESRWRDGKSLPDRRRAD
ncbi:MAG: LacI family DNA-binding transcriptional regulator [Chthoniobacteraceae bacterium]